MNTGKTIETKNLILLPSKNARDNIPFLNMLRDDGDFRIFCGVEYSETALSYHEHYFETPETCYYSLYRKVEPHKYIGHMGFYWKETRCEIEFYISKPYRNKGCCAEAARELIHCLFSKGLSVDGNIVLPSDQADTANDQKSILLRGYRVIFMLFIPHPALGLSPKQ